MAQIGERPPRFAIQVNSRSRVTRDYAYFIENRLRARYGLDGVPVIIDFNERGSGRRAPGGDHRADRLKAVQEDTFVETADVGFDVELEEVDAVDPYADFEDAPDFDGEDVVDDEDDEDLLGEPDLEDDAEDDQD
jgi:GTP-binding protein